MWNLHAKLFQRGRIFSYTGWILIIITSVFRDRQFFQIISLTENAIQEYHLCVFILISVGNFLIYN